MIENVTPGSKFRPKAADENYIREAARAFHTQKRSQSFDEVNVISGKTITLSNESSVNLKRGQVVPLFDLTYERTTDSTASEDIAEMRANEATLRWNIERGRINFKLTNDHLDADNLGDNFCVPIGVVVGGDINSNYVGEVLIDGVFASHTIDYSRSGLTLIQTNRSFPYDDAGLYPDYIDFIDSYFDTEPRATDWVRPEDLSFLDAGWFYLGNQVGSGITLKYALYPGHYGRIQCLNFKRQSANGTGVFKIDNWRNIATCVRLADNSSVNTGAYPFFWSGSDLTAYFNNNYLDGTISDYSQPCNRVVFPNAYPPGLANHLYTNNKIIQPLSYHVGDSFGAAAADQRRNYEVYGQNHAPIHLVPHRRRWEVLAPSRRYYTGWVTVDGANYSADIEKSGYSVLVGATVSHPWLTNYTWTAATKVLTKTDNFVGPVHLEYSAFPRQWTGASNADLGNGTWRIVGVGNANITLV